MPDLILELHLTPDQMLGYYRGAVRTIVARATNGQTVQFPASVLQRHVTADGVHGRFRMEFDASHKFVRLEQLPG
ncbi:DUF2835 domain-containing protein [Opitutus terrae]|uniref:DUF2835 domain-containing protein n=1 Tax=Opitutus terrae (strain DSM 11246 / JCM 15787 / PB90-1) TaxID=452637 RepID=B1ZNI5_OPITP|nr:DUF2835 domain-containing protein [Opitutus terrae]ACB74419.1 conserved hypothetical protein [Opitutus terrae PB90-1]